MRQRNQLLAESAVNAKEFDFGVNLPPSFAGPLNEALSLADTENSPIRLHPEQRLWQRLGFVLLTRPDR